MVRLLQSLLLNVGVVWECGEFTTTSLWRMAIVKHILTIKIELPNKIKYGGVGLEYTMV